MGIDGLFLSCLKKEIGDFAVGAKIDKIFMPAKYELVFVLRTRAETRRMFISAAGNAPRAGFIRSVPENPASPPMLCMLLRKLLAGAVITGVRQHENDRLLFFDLSGTNELGDRVSYTLAAELMGQNANCILLDGNGVIIDALKRVDSRLSSYREILPKKTYVYPPPQKKRLLPDTPPEEIVREVSLRSGEMLSGALVKTVSGCSPLLGKEIAYRVLLGDAPVDSLSPAVFERLRGELAGIAEALRSGGAPSYITGENGEPLAFSFLPLTHLVAAGTVRSAQSYSQMLELLFSEREKHVRARAKAADLFRTVDTLIERTSRKISAQREELQSPEEMEKKRRFAELINANIYRLPKGVSVYEVEDYYDNGALLRIPAKPELSPALNAQRYFKEYRKAQTAKKIVAEQIEKGEADLEYLKTVRFALENAETFGELSEIRAELSINGFLRSKTGTQNKKRSTVPPLTYQTPGGFTVLVGRNNLQNELITFKKAKKTDYWFHVKGAPGSHVILQCGDAKPSEQDMETAASIAAWHSSVRAAGSAEVDYTEARHIKKPPAARSGYVIYHVYKTALVKARLPGSVDRL